MFWPPSVYRALVWSEIKKKYFPTSENKFANKSYKIDVTLPFVLVMALLCGIFKKIPAFEDFRWKYSQYEVSNGNT